MTQSLNRQEDAINNPKLYAWQVIGAITLCIRFVQGFIFWGGGSRRFIYAPQKLDPHSTSWMANKLQSAMPGALLGLSDAINYLLHHFILLYIAIILFSLAELISGLALIIGFFTRTAALITVFISISLLLIFGWEGSTCLDEWTMAVSNLAMGLTLTLSGGMYYSIDSWLLRRHPQLHNRWWFVDAASGGWSHRQVIRLSWLCLIATLMFTLTTYNYYRGSIYSRYHSGPVSPVIDHYDLSNGIIQANGALSFHAYVNAGDTANPSHITRVELQDAKHNIVMDWNAKDLGRLSPNDIINDYPYNKIGIDPYGIVAPVSASATIKLSPSTKKELMPGPYTLILYTINGQRFHLDLHLTSSSTLPTA